MGMSHEHARPDATTGYNGSDKYITINWQNIPDMKIQYEPDDMAYIGSSDAQHKPYDYKSIMHYSNHGQEFAVDGVAIATGGEQITGGDSAEVNDIYQCSSSSADAAGTWQASAWGDSMHWCEFPHTGPIGHWQAVREDWCQRVRMTCGRSRSIRCVASDGGVLASGRCSGQRPALYEEAECPPVNCLELSNGDHNTPGIHLVSFAVQGSVDVVASFPSCQAAIANYSCTDDEWGDFITRSCPQSCTAQTGCAVTPAPTPPPTPSPQCHASDDQCCDSGNAPSLPSSLCATASSWNCERAEDFQQFCCKTCCEVHEYCQFLTTLEPTPAPTPPPTLHPTKSPTQASATDVFWNPDQTTGAVINGRCLVQPAGQRFRRTQASMTAGTPQATVKVMSIEGSKARLEAWNPVISRMGELSREEDTTVVGPDTYLRPKPYQSRSPDKYMPDSMCLCIYASADNECNCCEGVTIDATTTTTTARPHRRRPRKGGWRR